MPDSGVGMALVFELIGLASLIAFPEFYAEAWRWIAQLFVMVFDGVRQWFFEEEHK